MALLAAIDAERLAFAKLAKEASSRSGARTIEDVRIVRCTDRLSLVSGDVGEECITTGLELPEKAWNPALVGLVERLFAGSAALALRQLGGAR